MDEKKEINEIINSESETKSKGLKPSHSFPDMLENFDDDGLKKMQEKHKGSSMSLFRLAYRELQYINKTCQQLKVYDSVVNDKLKDSISKLDDIYKAVMSGSESTTVPEDDDTVDDIEKELRRFKKYIRKMKLTIPSKFNANELKEQLQVYMSATQSADQIAAIVFNKKLPRLHRNPIFEASPAFKDFELRYNALPLNLKLCLLCFSVFPVGSVIKKRLMVYWWIAEGFIEQQQEDNAENTKDLEQLGAGYFDELLKKDFIKPFHDKRRLEAETCKMPPFIRSAVITIAARVKFFDFDLFGKPEANCPASFRSGLLGQHGLESNFELEKFHLVFNISQTILDIRPEWIHRMKNVSVLYLGRWQSFGNHHIEVEDGEFLKGLSDMKHLKLLSLQGISRIVELPDSVTKLGKLTILDLRACHNLEKIPRDIGLLKSLTHLDLSECYLLDRMPKTLAMLKHLLVLKGFVVAERSKQSCTLEDLAKLPKLRKLSIFTGLRDFPESHDLKALQLLKVLTTLKVVWGGGAKKENNNQTQNEATSGENWTPILVDKPGNNETTSRELDTPTRSNVGDNSSAITPPMPVVADNVKLAGAPPAEPVVAAPAGDISKVPESCISKTTPSSNSGTQDMVNLKKLKNLKPNFCFGNTATRELDTKVADNSSMDPPAPVPVPVPEPESVPAPAAKPESVTAPTAKSELLQTPSENITKVSDNSTTSSSKGTPLQDSTKVLGRRNLKKNLCFWETTTPENGTKTAASDQLPADLKKLEIQCFPHSTAPSWLNPEKLKNLEKLYIRGGKLRDLVGDIDGWNGLRSSWKVKILRLKYLTSLRMNWKEARKLFPELIYLEKVNCPKLTFFPCDEAGVWINYEEIAKQSLAGDTIYLQTPAWM